MPTDVSPTALGEAVRRINRQAPEIVVHPVCATHVDAFGVIARLPPTRFALFIGSSIGNYETRDAEALLRGLRGSLHPGGAFLLGTDLRKSPDILLPAYDDARGVTAAFNKNVLARINRELGGAFDLDTFRHVAVWDEARSRVEMHLESLREQSVHIAELGLAVRFARGERIHTESSIKYDGPMVDTLLGSCGFRRERTFTDPDALFAVHLARA